MIVHRLGPPSQQGQKLLKKESDVGMLLELTGKQSTETSCWYSLVYKVQKQAACRDATYWFIEHRKKLDVGYHRENQCDEIIQKSLALHQ